MKTSMISIFLFIGCLSSCDRTAQKSREMEPLEVVETVKTSTGLVVRYRIPKAPDSWHCAGANLNHIGDEFRLSFVAAHDANDGATVDLPAENSAHPGIHQIEVPLGGVTNFSLFVDGKHEGDFELGRSIENKKDNKPDMATPSKPSD
jgi:hypothetical protein